jgi:hypothetical protein
MLWYQYCTAVDRAILTQVPLVPLPSVAMVDHTITRTLPSHTRTLPSNYVETFTVPHCDIINAHAEDNTHTHVMPAITTSKRVQVTDSTT